VLETWRRWFDEERAHGALGNARSTEVLNQFSTSVSLTMEPTP
jgi:hypothetical protein